MRNIVTLVAIAAVIVILSSCSKDNAVEETNGSKAINFGANVALTRAVIDSDESNLPKVEVAGIQILRGADGATPAWGSVSKVETTGSLGTTGTMSVAAPQYMNVNQSDANFMAYYPAADAAPASDKVAFTINGTQDLLVAPAKVITYAFPACAFAFAHKLSQVELVVKAAEEVVIAQFGNLTAATINADNKVDLTISSQSVAVSAESAKTDFQFYDGDIAFTPKAMTTGGITVGRSIVPAMSLSCIKMTFANREVKEYNLSAALPLVAGSKHIITATVSATGVTVTATLAAWGTGGEGTIPMQ